MKQFRFPLAALCLLTALLVMLFNRSDRAPPRSLETANVIPCIVLPVSEREVKVQARLDQATNGRFPFALPIEVELEPGADGIWERLNDKQDRWTLDIQSPAADSINLGFSSYQMPQQGRLEILDEAGTRPFRAFTAEDNTEKGELWTPIVRGEQVRLQITVPHAQRDDVRLTVASVNHGFRALKSKLGGHKIGNGSGQSCNIDVVCDATTLPGPGATIDQFRDPIRAVGAYTLGGIDQCSGALINNTANDLTPYFLTAFHCQVTAANAASMVVYWNYESATCRTVGSAANGVSGNGSTTQFSSGATFRAGFSLSDFTLVELNQALNPLHVPFFAGWNRTSGDHNGAVGIHHPDVGDKRISIENDPTTTTSYLSNTSPGLGSHIRVLDWDAGTTEGGSSGSPLFDFNKRIIGQLHGGNAACGNNESDWYGRLNVSWTGGGTSSTRLSNWLDPLNTGVTTLDGINLSEQISIADASVNEGNGGFTTINLNLTLSEAKGTPVTVVLSTVDQTASAGPDYTAILSRTVVIPAGATSATTTLNIHGDASPEENERLLVRLSNPINAILGDSEAVITILNDDFIPPSITGPIASSGLVNTPLTYTVGAQNTPTSWTLTGAPSGMSIAGPVSPDTDGLISWTPGSTGIYTFLINAVNGAGTDSELATFTILPNPLSDAIDTAALPIIGGSSWFGQTQTTHDGVDAAQSPFLQDNQFADLSVEVSGPDTLFFWWKVDSEATYDGIQLLIDGVQSSVPFFSGTIDWTMQSLPIPAGTHTVTWRYFKDESVADGFDTGWVDEVRLASANAAPIFTSANQLTTFNVQPVSFQVTATGAPTVFSATGLPANLSINASTGLISGIPLIAGTFPVTLTAANAASGTQQAFTLTVLGTVDEGTDQPTLNWSSTGQALWHTQTTTTHDGIDAAQSGVIGDNETSSMTVTIAGPETISFWRKVSSEQGRDLLRFQIDGVTQDEISGEIDWTLVSYILPSGPHVLTWTYLKDASNSAGDDRAWIDEVSLGPLAPLPDYNALLETTGLVWQTTAGATWQADNTTTFDGVDAARSFGIPDNASSRLGTTVIGPGFIRYRWRSSSESADFLSFTINGAHQQSISGVGVWRTAEFALTSGTNQLEWTFARDGGGAAGDDAGWLDRIDLLGYAGWVDQSDLTAALPTADPDGDGVSNLLAYAGTSISDITAFSDDRIQLHLDKPVWGVTGLTYSVESTTNIVLGGWASTPATILTNSSSAFTAEALGTPDVRFFRLRISP